MKTILLLFSLFCLAPRVGAQVVFSSPSGYSRSGDSRSGYSKKAKDSTSRSEPTAHYLERPAAEIAMESPSADSSMVATPRLTERQILDSLVTLKRSAKGMKKGKTLAEDLLPLEGVPSIYPIRDGWITSSFGMRRHPVTGELKMHTGVDLAANAGSPVFATASGVVHKIVLDPDGIGLAVYVRHAEGYMTVYGHLSGYEVKPGEKIRRGRQLGIVGATGSATGAHVHYAVLYQNKPVDPIPFCSLLSTYQHGSRKR